LILSSAKDGFYNSLSSGHHETILSQKSSACIQILSLFTFLVNAKMIVYTKMLTKEEYLKKYTRFIMLNLTV